ncbi:unnamed protein product [Protopolystoma xenopodis]|uniref:Uncharacterized protein n=1 Tax=Protopolystoma xenopodis TaxID=117903 RepID=A0A448XI43_9PLAT|nr:unnamed protein product [Protopolystoma xenopodis]
MPLTTSSKQGRISDSEQALLSSTSTLLNVSPGCFPKASPISVLGDSLLPQCHSSATGYLCPPVARSNFSDTTATRTVAIGPKEGSVKDDDEEMVQLAGSLSNTLGLLGDIQSAGGMQAPHDDTKESESIVGCLRQLRHRNDSRSSQESGTSGSVSTVSKYCFESRLQSASRSEPTEEDCLGVFNMHQDADATEALSDQPSPILVEWMRRRLYYFFMSPVEKFKTKRRLPYTLIIQLLKILIITIQVCTFLQHL